MIIYMSTTPGEEQLNKLFEFLHGRGFRERMTTLDVFTTHLKPTVLARNYNKYKTQIHMVTKDDVDRVQDYVNTMEKVESVFYWRTPKFLDDVAKYFSDVTNIVHYDYFRDEGDYNWPFFFCKSAMAFLEPRPYRKPA